jgi:hypothetical protein
VGQASAKTPAAAGLNEEEPLACAWVDLYLSCK